MVVVTRSVRCASSPEALWPLVADTDLLNRLAGMKPLEIEALEDDSAARYTVRTVLDGFPVEYRELPYQWEKPRWFQVRREMNRGAARTLEVWYRLERDGGGTRVEVELRIEPVTSALNPVVRALGRYRMSRFAKVIGELDQRLQDARAEGRELLHATPPPADTIARGVSQRELDDRRDELMERLPPELTAAGIQLVNHVARAHEGDLIRIRPFELADQWRMARRDLLRACLHGARAGLLTLGWDLICPSCQTGSERLAHLFDLDAEGHCDFCDIRFDLPADRAIEAVFRPHPAIRSVEIGPFCPGGPARTPHVMAQRILPAGETATLRAPEEPGHYRLFVRGGLQAPIEVDADGSPGAHLAIREGAPLRRLVLRPGAELRLESALTESRHVKLDRPGWPDRAATAHVLSLDATFRKLFTDEVLAADRSLQVERVTLLFSDLTASTALYAEVGDGPAFRFVQAHFDLLEQIVELHGGVVVKTIGDAVMAAFPDADAGLRAAAAMQTDWGAFRQRWQQDTALKIGLHAGPCYAITANGRLDYFGQTVNVAARLQSEARPGEIVASDAVTDRAGAWLSGWAVERFAARLKGVRGPIAAARMRPGDDRPALSLAPPA